RAAQSASTEWWIDRACRQRASDCRLQRLTRMGEPRDTASLSERWRVLPRVAGREAFRPRIFCLRAERHATSILGGSLPPGLLDRPEEVLGREFSRPFSGRIIDPPGIGIQSQRRLAC